MKRFWVPVVVLVMLFSVFGSACAAVESVRSNVSFETLSEDSDYVGTYYAERCNLGQCWTDSGTFTWFELKNPLIDKRVGVGYLKGPNAYLVLSAKEGYKWLWNEGSLFKDPGYYLVDSW